MKRLIGSRLRSGSFLVEAIVAITVFSIVAGAIVISLVSQLGAAQSSRETAIATSYAEEGLEAARAIRDSGWSALTTGEHGITWTDGAWTFSGASDTNNGFTRRVTVSDIDEHDRRVDVQVAWSPSALRTRTVSLSTILSDWRNAAQSDLGGDLGGDWTDPILIGAGLDFGSTFRGIAIDVASTTVGLVGFGTMAPDSEICMIDVANPLVPVKRGCLDTGVGANELSLNLTRKLAYLAYAATTNHLQIIDISNPDSLVRVKQFTIAGNTQKGRSLDRVGNLVYFGTEGPATKEFYVIDVTNTANPVIKGSVSIGNDVNDVMVSGNYAYLASDVDNKEAAIVNVSNPTSPTVTKLLDLPGATNAECVFYDPATQRLYVGRQVSTSPATPEVNIIDVSNPSNPVLVGSMEVDVDVDSIMAIGNMMFVLSRGDMEFRSYVVTDPADIRYYGGVDFGAGDVPTDVIYQDNVFYVAVFNRYGLRIVTAF